MDELGEPVWQCSENDVSRAYRQLSLSVHPDKNPSEEAKMAFDYLSKANKILSDPEQLVRFPQKMSHTCTIYYSLFDFTCEELFLYLEVALTTLFCLGHGFQESSHQLNSTMGISMCVCVLVLGDSFKGINSCSSTKKRAS